MNDNELKEIFAKADIPKPDSDIRKQAIAAACHQFEKNKKFSKGVSKQGRLTDKVSFINAIRRFQMSKSIKFKYAASAAVVVIAAIMVNQHQNDFVTKEQTKYSGGIDATVDSEIGDVFNMPDSGAVAIKDNADGKAGKNIAPAPPPPTPSSAPSTDEYAPTLEVASNEAVRTRELRRDFFKAKEDFDDSIKQSVEIDASAPMEQLKEEISVAVKPPQKMQQGRLLNGLSFSAPVRKEAKKKEMHANYAVGKSSSYKPSGRFINGVAVVTEDIRIMPYPIPTPIIEENKDKFEEFEVNPFKDVMKEPVSTFSVDVDTASYSVVRRAVNGGYLPNKNAVRIEELVNYFDYNYAVPDDKENPFSSTVAVYDNPWNVSTKLMHIGIKGYDIAKDSKPDANLVFLLDVSGSMNSHDKLPLLKKSFKMMVNSLNPDDTVAIVVYAGAAGVVLEPTKVSEKHKILTALDRLNAGGSTAGGAGIKRAYDLAEANFKNDGVNRIILATDGDFNVGISNREELKKFVEKKRKTGVFLSVLGFGRGNYNDALMQKLAQNGNGNAAYIDNLSEARKVLVEEASSTLFTIAKDVKLQLEFNPQLVSEYRLVGYESRMLKREDFNNDKIDAGDIGAGHTVTAIYEFTPLGTNRKNIDELRYKNAHKQEDNSRMDIRKVKANSGEYAFLKIRYKLPNEDKSTLITRPVTKADSFDSMDKVPQEVRFAASVAGFGQLLKGGKHTDNFTYDDVIKLGEAARGRDEFGRRAEFINIVRLVKELTK